MGGGSFQILDHTGETGILARGRSRADLFCQVARGMFSFMVDLDSVNEREERCVEADAPDGEALLVAWLNELIYLFDVEGLMFSRARILEIGDTHLKAVCYGERLDLDRHGFSISPKAATYHMLEVAKEPGGSDWTAKIILDI